MNWKIIASIFIIAAWVLHTSVCVVSCSCDNALPESKWPMRHQVNWADWMEVDDNYVPTYTPAPFILKDIRQVDTVVMPPVEILKYDKIEVETQVTKGPEAYVRVEVSNGEPYWVSIGQAITALGRSKTKVRSNTNRYIRVLVRSSTNQPVDAKVRLTASNALECEDVCEKAYNRCKRGCTTN